MGYEKVLPRITQKMVRMVPNLALGNKSVLERLPRGADASVGS